MAYYVLAKKKVATDYLHWCNFNGNIHLIETIITSSQMGYGMIAYETLRMTVKLFENLMEIGRVIKGSPVKYSAC